MAISRRMEISSSTAPAPTKAPRTDRGRRTMRKLLDAATAEFGSQGFHDASISGITRRAGVALGTFYTYFDSKDAIFRALVADMSHAVKAAARTAIADVEPPLDIERAALQGFLDFAAEHKEVYRIIDEAEFVDPASYRTHYETIAARIMERLEAGAGYVGGCEASRADGHLRENLGEVHAWAIMGMNVFLGLRFAIWRDDGDPSSADVARAANTILARGISA